MSNQTPPPDLLQFLLGLLALGFAVLAGSITKIAADVKRGDRHKFWSHQLWFDIPALFMMVAVARGVSVYFEFPPDVAAGVGAFLGYIGPRGLDAMFSRYVNRRSPGEDR